jgi:hypothetical protein
MAPRLLDFDHDQIFIRASVVDDDVGEDSRGIQVQRELRHSRQMALIPDKLLKNKWCG